MLTLTNKAPGPAFPSTSSVFFEVVASVFFLKDLIGGQPTTCALPCIKDQSPFLLLKPVFFFMKVLFASNWCLLGSRCTAVIVSRTSMVSRGLIGGTRSLLHDLW